MSMSDNIFTPRTILGYFANFLVEWGDQYFDITPRRSPLYAEKKHEIGFSTVKDTDPTSSLGFIGYYV